MRAKEFISESGQNSIQDTVADALPSAYVIPKLQNQDPYHMYRFGVALAKARGTAKAPDDVNNFAPTTPWGENQIVVSYGDPETEKFIDQALQDIGLSTSDKKLISTPKSQESKSVSAQSPVAKPKRNKYGV